MPRTFLVTALD